MATRAEIEDGGSEIAAILATAYLRILNSGTKSATNGHLRAGEESSPSPQIPLDSAPPLIADGTLAKEPQR